MKEIIIDGIKYVQEKPCSPIKIVILQRGWVMIGRFEKNGNDCLLHNAHVIRRWGTSNGLGQLALEGKQCDTVLEKSGTASFDYLTVVAALDCDESKWKNL